MNQDEQKSTSKNTENINLPAAYGNKVDNNKDDNLNSSFNPNDFNFHEHNGVDSKRLNPRNFLGFPVFLVANATVAPTDAAQEGVFRFYYDTVPVYRLWVRINKGWHYLTLT
jgi:hypothetical protein